LLIATLAQNLTYQLMESKMQNLSMNDMMEINNILQNSKKNQKKKTQNNVSRCCRHRLLAPQIHVKQW
jgi:hypothetical protein